MARLFPNARFVDFGSSAFLPGGSPHRTMRVEGVRASVLRSQVRLLAPQRPGVYGMLDAEEQLIYVGKAKQLRTRLQSYFRRSGRPAKTGRMMTRVRAILWEVLPSEFTSLLRELELIRRWRPRWNVQGQPLRRRLGFVCLSTPPAPYLFLSRKWTARVQAAYGPVTSGTRAQQAVRQLNDWFQLRDCPEPCEMIFPDQRELFPGIQPAGCLRLEIGTCLGPCTGVCTRRTYQAQVRLTRGFLEGTDLTALDEMQEEMETASATQRFEHAAFLRDRLESCRWLARQLERNRKAQTEMSFIYPVTGFDGATTWYLIHGARTIAALSAPQDAAASKDAQEIIKAIYQANSGLLDSYEHADSRMLVMQWFRQHPHELANCLTPEQALERALRGCE